MNYTCPVCGYKTFKEPPGSYDTCVLCGWEDDLSQLRFPETKGANNVTLIDAQKNFKKIGYSTYNFLVRLVSKKNSKNYKKDLEWRPLSDQIDYERPKPGVDYGIKYPEDLTKLYYWKNINNKDIHG